MSVLSKLEQLKKEQTAREKESQERSARRQLERDRRLKEAVKSIRKSLTGLRPKKLGDAEWEVKYNETTFYVKVEWRLLKIRLCDEIDPEPDWYLDVAVGVWRNRSLFRCSVRSFENELSRYLHEIDR